MTVFRVQIDAMYTGSNLMEALCKLGADIMQAATTPQTVEQLDAGVDVCLAREAAPSTAIIWDQDKVSRGIACPTCHNTSYNPMDIKERYCGFCHKFHSQMNSLDPDEGTYDPDLELLTGGQVRRRT